ncbi:MAG: hypothetical protein EOO38_26865 [Cytophagaceae bacterium]|nr:MAG: hypothetical protein EOO38_26865 [Cytophagaceae bacterium]
MQTFLSISINAETVIGAAVLLLLFIASRKPRRAGLLLGIGLPLAAIALVVALFTGAAIRPSGEYNCTKTAKGNSLSLAPCSFDKFVFQGDSSVVVYSNGQSRPATYKMDKQYARISLDTGRITLRVENENTLIKEDDAQGESLQHVLMPGHSTDKKVSTG